MVAFGSGGVRLTAVALALALVTGCSTPQATSSAGAPTAETTASPTSAVSTTGSRTSEPSPTTTAAAPTTSTPSPAASSPTVPTPSERTAAPAPIEPPTSTTPAGPVGGAVPVLSVIDGDTIHALVDGQDVKVRIIGIDTPETTECGFDRATAAATAVLAGQQVQLTADPTQDDRDRYDRLLRYVTLPDGQDFGSYMVGSGFAYEYTFDARYAHQDDYRSAQNAAAAGSLGLWDSSTCSGQRGVTADTPAAPVVAPSQPVSTPADESGQTGDCDIKGNISDNGKIYHVPGSRDYEKTKIDEGKGERWFCSTAEAEAAGWRAPRNG